MQDDLSGNVKGYPRCPNGCAFNLRATDDDWIHGDAGPGEHITLVTLECPVCHNMFSYTPEGGELKPYDPDALTHFALPISIVGDKGDHGVELAREQIAEIQMLREDWRAAGGLCDLCGRKGDRYEGVVRCEGGEPRSIMFFCSRCVEVVGLPVSEEGH
jgi:hypothetical protein